MSITDDMKQGNLDAIRSGIVSDTPGIVAAAIAFGIEHGINDPFFMAELEKQCNNSTTLLNVRIGDLASFAIEKNKEKQYNLCP